MKIVYAYLFPEIIHAPSDIASRPPQLVGAPHYLRNAALYTVLLKK